MIRRDWSRDALIAGIAAIVGVLGTVGTDGQSAVDRAVDALAITIVVLAAAVVVIRSRWPLVCLALTTTCLAVFLGLSYPYGPIFIPFFIALFTVASTRQFAVSVPASALAFLPLTVHLFTHPSALPGFLGLIPATAWVVVPFALGSVVRLSRESRERDLDRRLSEERLRIAQEVHDAVGHGLAAIKMRADVALHVIAKNPGEAEKALRAISLSSTEALGDIRSAVELIRGDRSPGELPGLRRLDTLVTRIRDAGVAVSVRVTGSLDLPEDVDAAAFRVVQESLTNVLKHAPRRRADVSIARTSAGVSIAVESPCGGSGFAPGYGITGMRERVQSLGGAFSAEVQDGRFVVKAELSA